MGVSKNNGTPKSSILIAFSIINHPFWGTPIFRNTQMGFLTTKWGPILQRWKSNDASGHHRQLERSWNIGFQKMIEVRSSTRTRLIRSVWRFWEEADMVMGSGKGMYIYTHEFDYNLLCIKVLFIFFEYYNILCFV